VSVTHEADVPLPYPITKNVESSSITNLATVHFVDEMEQALFLMCFTIFNVKEIPSSVSMNKQSDSLNDITESPIGPPLSMILALL